MSGSSFRLHIPTSLFPQSVLAEGATPPLQAAQATATPRTPQGTPRTSRDRQGESADRQSLRERRQKEMIVSEVLSDIDTSQISRMKEEFDRRGGSVDIVDFLRLFRDTLMEESARSNFRSVVGKLRTLFEEIDINGDKSMSWDEFTSFIVLNGGSRSRSEKDTQHYQESEMKHEIPLNRVERLRYFPEIERLVVCDKSEVVRLFKPTTFRFSDDLELVKELRGHTGAILNAEYIPSEQLLCTSSSDNTIQLWDASASYRNRGAIKVPNPQLALLWNQTNGQIYSSSTDGTIFVWSLATHSQKAQLVGHTDMTLDLKLIANTPLMASASLDAHIYIWDLTTGEITTQVKPGHTKGVTSLSYSSRQKLLFSGSYDRDILAWNPVVDSVVFKLKGHHTSILAVECIEDSPYLVSADRDGQFKLWDIRTCDCLQTFTGTPPISGLGAFTIIHSKKRIIAGAKRIHTFDYHKPGVPWLTDDRPISAVLFNSKSLTILTAAARDVKIWDASSGVQLQTFRGVTTEDITAACLDKRERKVILGTSDGQILVLNYTNGMLLRTMTPHKQEVTSIHPVGKNTFLSCSTDGRIWMHDETAPAKKSTVIASFIAPPLAVEPIGIGRDVTCMALSKDLKVVVTASISHAVRIWGMEDTSMEFQHKLHGAEVTGVITFAPFPVVASCDCLGNVVLFAIKPSIYKGHCLCRLANTQPNGQPCGVFSLAFVPETCSLLTGDENGDIKNWSLVQLFEILGIAPVSKRRESRPPSAVVAPPPPQQEEKALSGTSPSSRQGSQMHLQPGPPSKREAVQMPNPDEMAQRVAATKRWSAHTEPVQKIEAITDPPVLFSYSSDRRVRAWAHDGSYLGTLRQSPEGGRWSVPIDLASREAIDAEQVDSLLRQVGDPPQQSVAPSPTSSVVLPAIQPRRPLSRR